MEAVQRLSVREVTQRMVWMDAEQIGPAWDRYRHADLKATILNASGVKADGRPFTAADFLTDPWAPPPKPVNQDLQRRLIAAELEAMEDSFG